MKKVNFNKFNNIKTPESWIENAIKIPQNKKAVPFYLKPYFIATAASIVFCCVLSLIVFSKLGSNTSVFPIAVPKSTQTTADSESTGNNTFPQSPTQTATDSSGNVIFVEPVTNSEGKVIATRPVTDISGNTIVIQPVTEPNESCSEHNTVGSATVPVIATDIPSTDHLEPLTSSGTQVPTAPAPPTSIAAVPTTEAEITDPPDVWDTEPGRPPCDSGIFGASIYFIPSENSSFDLSGNIYCHIETLGGICFTQKYSSFEICQKEWYSKQLRYVYTPIYITDGIVYGTYKISFYDDAGHIITQSFYLGADYNKYIYE